ETIQLTPSTEPFVLDFFAGSGTTAHAVIELNREQDKKYKFIIAEGGAYFETVVVPRIQRLMYAPQWEDTTPTEDPVWEEINNETILPDWVQRSPRLIKVIRTESYEDSLNALELPLEREKRLSGQQSFLFNDE